jgi:hypothetical protein
MDIVIPLGPKCGWGHYNELKYALRSAEQYVDGLGKVWIIGHRPDWIKNVTFIEFGDPYTHNKDANLIQKIAYVSTCDVSDPFIRMSDDQVFLKPFQKTNYHVGEVGPTTSYGYPKWDKRIQSTYRTLTEAGQSTYNYDGHVPMVCQPKVMIRAAMRHNYGQDNGYCVNTLLLNYQHNEHVKMPADYKLACTRPNDFIKNQSKADTAYVLNYNDRGLSSQLKQFLEQRFPVKSRFEM